LKYPICARAYFNASGCDVCDAHYTEFESSNPSFTEEWCEKIGSILLHPGCNVKLYAEENYEGNSETIDGVFLQVLLLTK